MIRIEILFLLSFSFTLLAGSNIRSSSAVTGSFLTVGEKAAYFTVAGNPSDETETNGIIDSLCKITPSAIKPILGTNLPISSISIYATNPRVCSEKTPHFNDIPDALLPVPAIYRDRNNDGIFNGSDEILFYASGMNYWRLKSNEWEFRFNDFTEKRHFYVRTTQGSHPIEKLTQPEGTKKVQHSALQLIRTKKSTNITTAPHLQGWADRQWIWTSLVESKNRFAPKRDLDIKTTCDPTFPGKIRILTDSRLPVTGNEAVFTFKRPTQDSLFKVKPTSLINTWNPLPLETYTFELEVAGLDTSFLDIIGYDISYYRKLDMNGIRRLRFYSNVRSIGEAPVVSYSLSNIPTGFTAIIRKNPLTQEMVLVDSGTGFQSPYLWSDSTGKGYEYFVSSENAARIPTLEAVSTNTSTESMVLVRDLHNTSNRSDYMIVAPSELLNSSIKIAEHKKAIGAFLNPTVVATEDIYREFSGGVPDPTAIRNFMTFAFHHWQLPLNGDENLKYLLLVGTGHSDYKGIHSSNKNFIYPYIWRGSQHRPVVEDFFGYVTPGDTPESLPRIAVGRLLATSETDVDNFLKKLKYMESDSGDYSEWRNRYLFVSDDDRQQNTIEGHDMYHTSQSDDVADKLINLRPTAHIQKVNLFEYELNGVEKRGAKIDLINRINDGVSLVNFFGHGGFASMTDEGIFGVEDVNVLSNEDRYLLFLAFSCSVGFFDQPGKECIAGKMVTSKNNGAHTAIASTRASYATYNVPFAKNLYRKLFDSEKSSSIGEAYLDAKKQEKQSSYAIFGDPSFTPQVNNKRIELDIQNENGISIDTMKAVQYVHVRATIPSGHSVDSVRIHLENPEQIDVKRKDGYPDFNPKLGKDIQYNLPGKILLNQVFPVVHNQIDAKITIPPIVPQKVEGTKLRIYGWSSEKTSTVTGIKEDLLFDGIDYTNLDTTDKTGPNITIRLAQDNSEADTALPGSIGNRVVIDGFYVDTKDPHHVEQDPAVIELYFSDSSGIDIFGENVGEGITISIKDIRTAKNYNGRFRSIGESPNKGKITLSLRHDEFPRPGEYELIVTASDFNQNTSKERFIVDVKSTEQGLYSIGDFYAYPSPAHIGEHTRFYYNAPDFRVHRMTLKVFTLSGQLVRQFNDVRPGVFWDLRDQRGNQLSPDVYLYRLYVERDAPENIDLNSTEREKEIITSSIRKMVIYPPR